MRPSERVIRDSILPLALLAIAICLPSFGSSAARGADPQEGERKETEGAADAGGKPAEEDAVFSGPQKDEKLARFKVRGVYDKLAGKELDFIADAKEAPVFLIFVHKLTRPSWGLTRTLTAFAAAKYGAGESGKERVATRVVWLSDDLSEAREYLTRARRSLNPSVPLGISVDGGEGPGSYGLNRKVTLTILVGVKSRVTANFALVQPSDTDATKVLAEVAKLVGEKAPTAREIARFGPAGMRRGARGKAKRGGGSGGDRDPELVSLLRAVIQKELDAEGVASAAKKVDAYLAKKPGVRPQLVEIASIVVERGYGTAAAQERFKVWAKSAERPERDAKRERPRKRGGEGDREREEGEKPERKREARGEL